MSRIALRDISKNGCGGDYPTHLHSQLLILSPTLQQFLKYVYRHRKKFREYERFFLFTVSLMPLCLHLCHWLVAEVGPDVSWLDVSPRIDHVRYIEIQPGSEEIEWRCLFISFVCVLQASLIKAKFGLLSKILMSRILLCNQWKP